MSHICLPEFIKAGTYKKTVPVKIKNKNEGGKKRVIAQLAQIENILSRIYNFISVFEKIELL